ncbi:unnamed protein product [Ectocarpus sp. 4 AP-2014]
MGDNTQPDVRNLTLSDIVEAWRELRKQPSGGGRFQKVVGNLEKSDYRLYGINVRSSGRKGNNDTAKGTAVKRGGKEGEVRKFGLDPETGLNVFDIRWSGGVSRETLNTREVLRFAEGDQGVVSAQEDNWRVALWI